MKGCVRFFVNGQPREEQKISEKPDEANEDAPVGSSLGRGKAGNIRSSEKVLSIKRHKGSTKKKTTQKEGTK